MEIVRRYVHDRSGVLIILDQSGRIAKWVGDKIGVDYSNAVGQAVASNDGELLAGIVWYMYIAERGWSQISLAVAARSPRWASPSTLVGLASYPFGQLSVDRIELRTAKRNKRARRVAEGLGFRYEGMARNGWPRDDAAVYGMTPESCPWINRTTMAEWWKRRK